MSTPPTPAKANEPLELPVVTRQIVEYPDGTRKEHVTESFASESRTTVIPNGSTTIDIMDGLMADRTKLLADLAAMREAGDKMREALLRSIPVGNIAFNLGQSHRAADIYLGDVKRLDEARRESCNAWDALTPPR